MAHSVLRCSKSLMALAAAACVLLLAACSGLHRPLSPPPTVTITASPTTIASGQSTSLTVAATNATQVVISNNVDSTTSTLPGTGGTQSVSPTQNVTYTATATGSGQTATATVSVTVTPAVAPTVTIAANPTTINIGQSSVLTVVATNATQVVISNNVDSTTYPLSASGGTQTVTPTKTVTYTATATGGAQTATATVVVTVNPATLQSIQHVIFLLQENRTFDTYFGMLNPYRIANSFSVGDDGVTYSVDGIDDKLTTISNQDDEGDPPFTLFHTSSTCLDDMSSAWLESYGDVNRYNFSANRPIPMDGFVHTAEGFAKSCVASGTCSGTFTDVMGRRAMAYYQDTGANGPELNYYYYMASQFALSDRWFSPVASKSTPNRIATYSGGTTEGLVRDPSRDDQWLDQNNVPQIKPLTSKTIFQELDAANVSWKIYYSETQDNCPADGSPCATPGSKVPSTTFTSFGYSGKYLYTLGPSSPTCTGTTKPDPTHTFCIDPNKIAPITQYYADVAANTLPSFAYIEAEYGISDEHPGSGQSIFNGQQQAAKLINALMSSPSWLSSAFFLAYDEGGGPYDHVPPVPGHTNDFTTGNKALYPDIGSIAVDADAFKPCQPPAPTDPTRLMNHQWTATQHCDLQPDLAGDPAGANEPGDTPTDAAAISGFKAQLGFRVPNMIISPYARKHYVGHNPMDHTAVLRFVESRFLNGGAHLTPRVSAQPDLLDFFDFTNSPWVTPPPNVPSAPGDLGGATCHPSSM